MEAVLTVNMVKVYQLGLAMVILVTVAVIGERYRNLAGIVTAMPLQIPLAMWIVYTSTGGDVQHTTGFARAAFFGIIPTAIFCLVCWFALSRGMGLARVLLLSYAIWLIAVMFFYRLLPK